MEEKYSSSNTTSMSEDIRQLAQSFLLAKREFIVTGKSGRNDHQHYSYAKIEDIYRAVEESLIKNNIIIWHFSSLWEGMEVLNTRLIHTLSGQFVQDSRILSSEKPGNQSKGAATTYMKKYAVLSLCAIATEDDDGQEEEKYIAKKNTENFITSSQVKELSESIRKCLLSKTVYESILRLYKINDLTELKSSFYNEVKRYIDENKNRKRLQWK